MLQRLGASSRTLARRRIPKMSSGITSSASTPNPLPASFLRGGTSKGIFLNKAVLPADRSEWTPIFLGIMGSPDPEYGRQLNGMGGGVSSLSKIMVVAPPTPEQKAQGIEVEYTFVQVGIRDSSIDYSGNCGNLTSMIGVYAVDEGVCPPPTAGRLATIRCFNTNTQKVIDTTFPVSETGAPILDLPEVTVAGVPGKASKIVLDFIDPGGARTGKLLPSGNQLTCSRFLIPRNLLALSRRLWWTPQTRPLPPKQKRRHRGSGPILETIRQQGAKRMGLDPSAQAQPKIAMLRAPHTNGDASQHVDIVIHALSMGVLHKAVPMTVGLCLGVASKINGTIAWDIARSSSNSLKDDADLVRIRHPGGLVDVGAEFGDDGQVKSAKVVRTGKWLMKGMVWH
ncbi:PrpF protein [Flammula alnicola]|nr:PrpF protein [Flammula alnicola]